jgi:lipoprotein-anchoring transpeptidase ErfK/SrfK
MRGFPKAVAVLGLSGSAAAQGLPPWAPSGHLPLSEQARSVEILRADEPLFVAPNPAAQRRGAAALAARLPLYAAIAAPGCRTDWLMVGPTAWLCGDVVRVTLAPAIAASEERSATPDGMPRPYYFVGSDGAFGYGALSTAGQSAPVAEMQPGFAISITATGNGPRNDAFGLTTKGFWLPMQDLRPARPSTFRGYEPARGALDRGWIVAEVASSFAEPGGKRADAPAMRRFDVAPILERRKVNGRDYVRVGAARWLDASDVRAPTPADVPDDVREGERWIDVDLANQVVTAYQGAVPVFTTLASTGTGKGQELTATPLGAYRIWVKLRTSDMDNLEDTEARRYYAMADVPWVLFFKKGFGLHAAFWHDSFGHVRSHGCVNLTPLDAERLFYWSSPRLPAGWTAALPTDYDPGTLVRVR